MESQTDEHSQQMYRLIESWSDSGMSKKKFCEEHQIAPWKFFYWQKKYREKNEGVQNSFVPVRTGAKKISQQNSCIEIIYPNGVRLQLPSGTGLNIIRSMLGII